MRSTLSTARQMEYRWRRHALAICEEGGRNALHGFAGINFVDLSKVCAPYVELHSLRILVMYLENARPDDRDAFCVSALRLSGYRASVVPHGVQWGGQDNSEIFKNLKLMPGCGARRERIDCRRGNLLRVSMDFRSHIVNAIRRRNTQLAVQLPRAWAAFRAADARRILGEGPEFEQACREAELGGRAMIDQTMRRFEGLRLAPLDWVGSELRNATTVFVETASSPTLQVVRIDDPQTELVGYVGANSFDFYHSRFRR